VGLVHLVGSSHGRWSRGLSSAVPFSIASMLGWASPPLTASSWTSGCAGLMAGSRSG